MQRATWPGRWVCHWSWWRPSTPTISYTGCSLRGTSPLGIGRHWSTNLKGHSQEIYSPIFCYGLHSFCPHPSGCFSRDTSPLGIGHHWSTNLKWHSQEIYSPIFCYGLHSSCPHTLSPSGSFSGDTSPCAIGRHCCTNLKGHSQEILFADFFMDCIHLALIPSPPQDAPQRTLLP